MLPESAEYEVKVAEKQAASKSKTKVDLEKDKDFIASETPYYTGRAIAMLAADPKVSVKAGKAFYAGDVADEYGFNDADGNHPHWKRHRKESDT